MSRQTSLALRASILLGLACTLQAQETVVVEATRGPLSNRQKIHHVLSRFTMGATPELFAEVEEKGIEAWFEEQLEATLGEPLELIDALDKLPSLEMTNREIVNRYNPPLGPNPTREQLREANRRRQIPRTELMDAVLLRAIQSRNQIREVSSDFFRNHFTVSVDKGGCRYYATEYEREVIRANALGKFDTMLKESAKHPAMLIYLDQHVSRRPLSKTELKAVARRVRQSTKSREAGEKAADIAAQRGLNENYARELLELHTLGVDRYYTQQDVEQVAQALTGWTVSYKKGEPIEFMYRGDLHMDNPKKVLGKRFKADNRHPTEGDKIIEMLSTHQGTARFLSWKLCRWLVNDEPSEEMVKRVEQVFWKSKGDLKETFRAILNDPEFFERKNYQTKFKRPFEYVVSALRVTGAEVTNVRELRRRIDAMSEPYYRCLDPTGFYDQAEAWQDPGAIAVRWKFAFDLINGKVKGAKIADDLYDVMDNDKPELWKHQLAQRLAPGGLSPRTSAYIDKLVNAELDRNPFVTKEEVGKKIAGAILGSPDFQKQ